MHGVSAVTGSGHGVDFFGHVGEDHDGVDAQGDDAEEDEFE